MVVGVDRVVEEALSAKESLRAVMGLEDMREKSSVT